MIAINENAARRRDRDGFATGGLIPPPPAGGDPRIRHPLDPTEFVLRLPVRKRVGDIAVMVSVPSAGSGTKAAEIRANVVRSLLESKARRERAR